MFDIEEPAAAEPTLEQKRLYFRELQDPHAHDSIFGNPDDNRKALEKELDEVLNLYKPFVARNDWERVIDYRPIFIREATKTAIIADRTISRLQKLKFSLPANEKVEFNRAPAARIIGELEKLLK
jgi:hypothetical protein